AFQLGHSPFERFAVRVIGARVVVTFVLSQLFVHIRRRLIDRRDDGACCRVGLLVHVNGISGKTHCALLALFSHPCEAGSLVLAALRSRARLLCSCPGIASEQVLENLQELSKSVKWGGG